MKKLTTFFAAVILAFTANAQVTFETLPLDSTHYWKGNAGVAATTPFSSGVASFTNRNDTSSFGDYWGGWGYSSKQDTISIDYTTNDLSAITGIGHNNSNVYGVAYMSFNPEYNHIRFGQNCAVAGFYITNTTIAYRSMQNGDFAAKKFGGVTGNDPDFFRIDVTGWIGGNPIADTVQFYLADFRDTNNANDYIVNDWRWVNTISLGVVDSLTYNLVSSDNGSFGMNTPAYFCIDDLEAGPVGTQNIVRNNDMSIYPIPANDFITLENKTAKILKAAIMNVNGQLLISTSVANYERKQMNLQHLAKGTYFVQIIDGETISYKKFTK